MIKRLLTGILLVAIVLGIGACGGGLANGNLVGVVVREGSGEIIQNPVLIIGRTLASPTVPPQQIQGDIEGRFEITIPGGNYTVQIGSSVDGPFFTWPDSIYVEENNTTVALFQLPEGY